jgi:D-alanyl-D-alanine carboxypeptidase
MYVDNVLAVPTAILQNPTLPTPPELARDMVMLEVNHYTFLNTIKTGRILLHRLVVEDVQLFFREAYMLRFPILSLEPVDRFKWCDEVSCTANNSSGHSMRYLDDGRMSKHGIGCAFDINPFQNPCFVLDENTPQLDILKKIPKDGTYNPGTPGTLQKGHPLVELMIELGWAWGGNWTFPKDYQHFQIVPPELSHYVQ